MIVYLPDEKKCRIVTLCKKLFDMQVAKIRFVAKVVGTLVAALSAVEYGKLFYRKLEQCKIEALRTQRGNFDAHMTVTEEMRQDLSWWISNVHAQVRRIQRPAPHVVIATDASMKGWGCNTGKEAFNGVWTLEEQTDHINVLELKAVLFSILALGEEIKDRHVRVLSNSTTAVTYINKMGGLTSEKCNQVAKNIWSACMEKNVWISSQHIPGESNDADKPSREFKDDLEWQIRDETFAKICRQWPTPTIDLFASRAIHKLNIYCSWNKDPGASFIDAFSLDWNQFQLSYQFPPFSLVSRCLQKLQQDNAEAIIIAPLWPQQLWFPTLLRSLIDYPRVLRSTTETLHLAHSEREHPLSPKLKLIACRVSGNSSRRRTFQMRQSNSSFHPGEREPERNMAHIYLSGTDFAVDGISIPFFHL